MLTEEQKAARLGKVTSSVIYDVLYAPDSAYRKIQGLDEFSGNEQTRIGDALEDPVRELAAESLDLASDKAPFRRHDILPWAADSCDARFFPRGGNPDKDLIAIGEIKTHGEWGVGAQYNTETGDIPEHVALQSHWHLIHWPQTDVCYVCPLLGGYRLSNPVFPMHRSSKIEGILLEVAARFHRDFIATETMPPPNHRDGDVAKLSALYPTGNGNPIEADAELVSLVHERVALKSEASATARRIKEIDATIREFIGENSTLTYDGNALARLTDVRRKGYTVEPTEFRQLRILVKG